MSSSLTRRSAILWSSESGSIYCGGCSVPSCPLTYPISSKYGLSTASRVNSGASYYPYSSSSSSTESRSPLSSGSPSSSSRCFCYSSSFMRCDSAFCIMPILVSRKFSSVYNYLIFWLSLDRRARYRRFCCFVMGGGSVSICVAMMALAMGLVFLGMDCSATLGVFFLKKEKIPVRVLVSVAIIFSTSSLFISSSNSLHSYSILASSSSKISDTFRMGFFASLSSGSGRSYNSL